MAGILTIVVGILHDFGKSIAFSKLAPGTTKEFVARVPAVYLTSAEGAVLSVLSFNKINAL